MGWGAGECMGREFKGLASGHCEARRAVAVIPNTEGVAFVKTPKFKELKAIATGGFFLPLPPTTKRFPDPN